MGGKETGKRVPATRRIAADVEREIAAGQWKPGARLPGVRELAERYRVSSAVALSAYRRLEKRGWVVRRSRSGTFVAEHPGKVVGRNTFFSWEKILPLGRLPELAAWCAPGFRFENYWGAQYYSVPGYIDWIELQLSGKEAREGIILFDEGMFPGMVKRNLLMPLGELRRDSGLQVPEFEPALLRACSYGGQLFGVPFSFSPVMLFYGRRIFERNGIPEPTSTWNWDDLMTKTKLLTRVERGRVTCYGLGLLTDPSVWGTFIHQNDGEFFDCNGNCAFDSDEACEALGYCCGLLSLPGVCHHTFGDRRSMLVDRLAEGRAAMVIGNGIDYAMLTERLPPEEWGVVALPGRRNHRGGFGVHALGISRNCRNPKETFRAIGRVFAPEFYRDYCSRSCLVPACDFERYGIPEALRNVARTGRILWIGEGLNALPVFDEIKSLLLRRRSVFSTERCRELCAAVNAGL